MTATATPESAQLIEYRQVFIDGRWVDTETGATAPVINPATEQPIGIAPVATAADARAAIAAARRAFDEGPGPQ